MLKVQSYINSVSHSLLSLIDNMNPRDDGTIYIEFNKEQQEYLKYQIISNIKNEIHYGCKNILIRSCTTKNNWRQQERGKPIKSHMALIEDDCKDTIILNSSKLEYFLNSFWNKKIGILIKNITLIEDVSMDTKDILTCINSFFPSEGFFNMQYYKILIDGNSMYSHESEIPSYLYESIGNKLRGYNLIF